MTPQERVMLEKALKLSEENNEILRGMRRSARLGRLARLVYWVVIIGISIAAYYSIEPYLKQFQGVNGSGSTSSYAELLKQYQDLSK